MTDHSDDMGEEGMTYLLDNLKADSEYNITVVARNIHGDSDNSSEYLTFTTFGRSILLTMSLIVSLLLMLKCVNLTCFNFVGGMVSAYRKIDLNLTQFGGIRVHLCIKDEAMCPLAYDTRVLFLLLIGFFILHVVTCCNIHECITELFRVPFPFFVQVDRNLTQHTMSPTHPSRVFVARPNSK